MLQDTKLIYRNLLNFYTLTIKYQKKKLRKNPIYNHIKKSKIPRNKSKEVKSLYSENYKTLMKEAEEERNGRKIY